MCRADLGRQQMRAENKTSREDSRTETGQEVRARSYQENIGHSESSRLLRRVTPQEPMEWKLRLVYLGTKKKVEGY